MSTREVISTYMQKMKDGDFEGAFDMFSAEGTYTIIGDTPVSKTFVGPDGVKADLMPLLQQGFAGLPDVNCTAIIAEGERGVALGHGEGPGKYGTYRQKHYAFVFRVRDGKVDELIEFMDPTQLSINCFGQTLSPLNSI